MNPVSFNRLIAQTAGLKNLIRKKVRDEL